MLQTAIASIEANRALGAAFFAAQDRLRGGPAEALCAPGYRAVIGANAMMDRAGHEWFARAFYGGFSDARHDIEEVVATEDRAVVRLIIRGTHDGTFFGIPATGRPIAVATHVIMHVAGGQVQQLFGVFDEAGLLRQIGVLPVS